jgi:hypothetical protein
VAKLFRLAVTPFPQQEFLMVTFFIVIFIPNVTMRHIGSRVMMTTGGIPTNLKEVQPS